MKKLALLLCLLAPTAFAETRGLNLRAQIPLPNGRTLYQAMDTCVLASEAYNPLTSRTYLAAGVSTEGNACAGKIPTNATHLEIVIVAKPDEGSGEGIVAFENSYFPRNFFIGQNMFGLLKYFPGNAADGRGLVALESGSVTVTNVYGAARITVVVAGYFIPDANLAGVKGERGEKGEKGDPGTPGTVCTVKHGVIRGVTEPCYIPDQNVYSMFCDGVFVATWGDGLTLCPQK